MTSAIATASGVAASVTSSVRSSCQAVNPMKPTSIATISAVPMRKDLSVIRETTSRRVTSNHAGSVLLSVLMRWPPGRSR